MKTQVLTIVFLFTLRLYAGIGTGTSSIGTLPVELTSFTALATNNYIQLNWTTATEVHNYGFYIERTLALPNTPSNEASLTWSEIGFEEGNGNSNSPKEYSFVDNSVPAGVYQYRLKQVNTDGTFEYSEVIEVAFGSIPNEYNLSQNYPNPFNPVTVISYSIPSSSKVLLKIYDAIGKVVTTLVNQNQDAGNYKIDFDASELSSGVYYYKIQTGEFTTVKKMLLIK